MAVGGAGRAVAARDRTAGEPRTVCRRVSARTAGRGASHPAILACSARSALRRCPLNMNESSGRGRVFQGLRRRRRSMAARRPRSDQRKRAFPWASCGGGSSRTGSTRPKGVRHNRPDDHDSSNRRGATRNGFRAWSAVEQIGTTTVQFRTSGSTGTKSPIRIQALRRCRRLPRAEILEGVVRRRRAIARQDRSTRPGDVGAGRLPRRTSRLSSQWSQLVRGRGIRGILRQAAADRFPLWPRDRASVIRPGGCGRGEFQRQVDCIGAQLKDLGTYGTYGLAGNVKEWIWNATDDRRNVVGGAWNDPPYMALNREPRSPLDRHQTHGFRCVRDVSPLPAEALAAIPPLSVGRTDKPVGDDLYAVGQSAACVRPWSARPAGRDPAGDRLLACRTRIHRGGVQAMSACPFFSFCPRTPRRPINPSSGFLADMRSAFFHSVAISAVRRAPRYFNFLTRSGRALVVPVYQGDVPAFCRRRRGSATRIR